MVQLGLAERERRMRRILILVVVLLVCAGVWELRYAVAEGVACYAAGRLLLHKAGWRRRRPKASWAKNGEALALLIAAWTTRGLVRPEHLRRKPHSFDGPAARPRRTYARDDSDTMEIPYPAVIEP